MANADHRSDPPRESIAPRRTLALMCALAAMAACATAGHVPVATSPFTADDARVFDQGISYLTEPGALGGEWESDWRESLELRVQRADVVALVRGHTYREDTMPSRHRVYRLAMTVVDELYGELDEMVDLVSRESDEGHATIAGREEQILLRDFVAFIKWRRVEATSAADGASASRPDRVEAAFHLEPASEAVVDEVRALLGRMRTDVPGQTTVHIQED